MKKRGQRRFVRHLVKVREEESQEYLEGELEHNTTFVELSDGRLNWKAPHELEE